MKHDYEFLFLYILFRLINWYLIKSLKLFSSPKFHRELSNLFDKSKSPIAPNSEDTTNKLKSKISKQLIEPSEWFRKHLPIKVHDIYLCENPKVKYFGKIEDYGSLMSIPASPLQHEPIDISLNRNVQSIMKNTLTQPDYKSKCVGTIYAGAGKGKSFNMELIFYELLSNPKVLPLRISFNGKTDVFENSSTDKDDWKRFTKSASISYALSIISRLYLAITGDAWFNIVTQMKSNLHELSLSNNKIEGITLI